MDDSFPVRGVNTFDNTEYQQERRSQREQQIKEMEEAASTAAMLRESCWREDVAAFSKSHQHSWTQEVVANVYGQNANLAPRCSEEYNDNGNRMEEIVLREEKKEQRRTAVGTMALLMEFCVACWGARYRWPRKIILGLCVMLSLTILMFTIMVTILVRNNAPSEDIIKFPPYRADIKDLKRHADIRTIIFDAGLSSSNDLDIRRTASNMALRWLTDYDGAQLDPSHEALLQRYALAVLFFSTHKIDYDGSLLNITEWNRTDYWMTEKGNCMWYGVSCPSTDHGASSSVSYNDNAEVLKLNLHDNSVFGTIPSEIQELSKLQLLDLGKNTFVGRIPSSLGKLQDLSALNLMDNSLMDALPSQLGGLTELNSMNLGSNYLEGTVPSEIIEKLTKLEYLGLDHNSFNGTLPNFRNSVDLVTLRLESNDFTGTIHGHLENLVFLENLRLSNNHLIGIVPSSVFVLPNLEFLSLSDNYLTGIVPDVFRETLRLKELQLSNNRLAGTLPPSIGQLDALSALYLEENKFNGSIPAVYGRLDNLEVFFAFYNELTGSLPITIGGMKNLKEFRMDRNGLTGSLPSEIALATNLVVISLHNNKLNGTIPESVGKLEHLRHFSFYANEFSGVVPSEVCELRTKKQLTYLAGDCSNDFGSIDCDCCHECFPPNNMN